MKKNILKNISKLVGLMIVFSATSCFCKEGDDSLIVSANGNVISLSTEKTVNLEDFKLKITEAKYYDAEDLKGNQVSDVQVVNEGILSQFALAKELKKADGKKDVTIKLKGTDENKVKSYTLKAIIEKGGKTIKDGDLKIEVKKAK